MKIKKKWKFLKKSSEYWPLKNDNFRKNLFHKIPFFLYFLNTYFSQNLEIFSANILRNPFKSPLQNLILITFFKKKIKNAAQKINKKSFEAEKHNFFSESLTNVLDSIYVQTKYNFSLYSYFFDKNF